MRSFLFIIMTFCAFSCSTDTSSESSEGKGKIVFEDSKHDFGNLVEGDVVSHAFVFTNKGSEPLTVLDVQVSCGCTVASKPSESIGVGQKGEIVIEFNSSGKPGINNKGVGVISNASNSQEVLNFTAVVTAKTEKEEEL